MIPLDFWKVSSFGVGSASMWYFSGLKLLVSGLKRKRRFWNRNERDVLPPTCARRQS